VAPNDRVPPQAFWPFPPQSFAFPLLNLLNSVRVENARVDLQAWYKFPRFYPSLRRPIAFF